MSLAELAKGDQTVDAGYRLLSAKYVRTQAKQLRAQFEGIRAAEDIEFVHKARVASRRLGAAMQMFGDCFKRKQIKLWKKAIRRIRSELSEARDKDVQIELLREIQVLLPDQTCLAGISRLLVDWEYQRERLQGKVIKAVDRLERKGFLKEMVVKTKRMLVKARSHDVHEQTHASFARAEQEILGRLDGLLALQDCLGRPDDRVSHHAMRIAAKRLRYTIEIVRPLYGDSFNEVINAIKQVQTLLGEIHDCDVWQEQLDRFVEQERVRIKSYHGHAGPFTRLNTGIEFFRQDRLRHRQQSFEDLMRLWGELDVREVWEKLVSIVQLSGLPPKASVASETIEATEHSNNNMIEKIADQSDATEEIENNLEDSPALLTSSNSSDEQVSDRHRSPHPASIIP